jgi:outer membrane murein-binding lipoprotein Lpp
MPIQYFPMKKILLPGILFLAFFAGCVPKSKLDQANSDLTAAQTTIKSLQQDLAAAQAKLESTPQDYAGDWQAETTQPMRGAPNAIPVKLAFNLNLSAKGDVKLQVMAGDKKLNPVAGTWKKALDYLIIDMGKGHLAVFPITAKKDNQITLLWPSGQNVQFNRAP